MVGPVDSPFFDAVHAGAEVPGDGLWNGLVGRKVGLGAGWRSAAAHPVATAAGQGGCCSATSTSWRRPAMRPRTGSSTASSRTHLSGDYHDDADVVAALADATNSHADELVATPSLLFDCEISSGTTERLQDAMIEIGAVGYERPLPESQLVDRTLALDALGLPAR